MLPVLSLRPPQPQVITKVSISALVISLPILYVSLLRLPPSTLARDTTFWFLMSNSIIVIIAADSGMLFFRSNSTASGGGGDDDGPSSYLPGDTQSVAVEEDSPDAHSPAVPLMASFGEPTTVNVSDVVRGDVRLQKDGVTSCKTTNTDMEGHPLPLIKVEEKDEDATSKPSTDVNHALVVRAKEEEEVTIEATTNKNYAMIAKGEEEEEEEDDDDEVASKPNELLVEDGDDVADELAIINYDYAFAETEPWRPRLVTSKSLVEEEEDQCPISDPRVTPGYDVQQDKSIVVAREGKLRRSATEGRRPAEEREYWQLSDEELNRRVEEFITRFNREMRLQIEQETGV